MGHPFCLINQLNGFQINALHFPNHGFTKEALNQTGKFIQLILKGDAPGNPHFRLMRSCYQLSKGVYQDDQLAKEFVHLYQLPEDTYDEIPCYFLMENNLIQELLSYDRPTVTINWQINPNGTINFEKSTIDIDGLLTKTPSQNPKETIKPDDYINLIYYQKNYGLFSKTQNHSNQKHSTQSTFIHLR